jgi:alpha-ketoglutarate-dependent taurine dioxygenase
MPVTIRKLHPLFVGEVTGVDLTKPISPDDAAAIERGMDNYAVLIFPKQDITTNSNSLSHRISVSARIEKAAPSPRRKTTG